MRQTRLGDVIGYIAGLLFFVISDFFAGWEAHDIVMRVSPTKEETVAQVANDLQKLSVMIKQVDPVVPCAAAPEDVGNHGVAPTIEGAGWMTLPKAIFIIAAAGLIGLMVGVYAGWTL